MIITKNNGREEVVRIHIYLNTICNLKCSYCYMRNGDSWGRTSKKENLEKIIEKLNNINIPIDIILLGGEPTYYPLLKYALNKFDNIINVRNIYLLSNGTRTYDYYNNLLKEYSKLKLYLTYHSLEYNEDSFVSNCLNLEYDKLYINILLDDIQYNYSNIISKLNNYKLYGTYLYDMDNNNYSDLEYFKLLDKYKSQFDQYISIDNKLYNDIEIILYNLNSIKNIKCYNNNLYCNLHEDDIIFYQNCSDKIKTIDDINNLKFNISCPLDTCSCQGMLSDYKESNE